MSFVVPLFTAIGSGISSAAGGLASLASGGLGTALSAGSAILGTVSAIGASNYQAQVAQNNAKLAEQNAALASDQTQQEQVESDRQTAALIGEQEAIQGASGLRGASQIRTRRSANRLGRQDALNIREAGSRQIQSFLQDAENFRGEARSAKANARASLVSGFFDVGSSLIGGASTTRARSRITGERDPWVTRRGVNLRSVY